MSWLFSQALEEESWEDISSDGKPFARLNEIDMPHRSWLKDKTTDSFVLSRSGMTFARLTESRGEELLMSYLEASRAKISRSPELDSDCRENAPDSGESSLVLLAKFDRSSSSWKTLQCSLVEDWTSSLRIFARSGLMLHGSLWALSTSELRTNETGSGLSVNFPTPTTIDSGSRFNRSPSNGATLRPTLGAMAKNNFWPTPLASDAGRTGPNQKDGQGKPKLAALVAQRETQPVTMWPTPRARDWKDGAYPNEYERNTPSLATHAGGSLSPLWVEWLMGWPIGWTDCAPLGTDKFLSWQRSHGLNSEESLIGNDEEPSSPRINSPSNNRSDSKTLPRTRAR
jgi:hypothetical protein